MHSGLNGAGLLRKPLLIRETPSFSKPEPSLLTENNVERISGHTAADLHIELVVFGNVVILEGHR